MSHPNPLQSYSDQHNQESNSSFKGRRAAALKKAKLSPIQKATSNILRTAGNEMSKNARKGGEAPLQHLKRLVR